MSVWTLLAAFSGLAVVLEGGLLRLLAGLGLGGALILLSLRRKASPAADALYTASADYLLSPHQKMPGQLSLTAEAISWRPSRYSRRRGQSEVVFPLSGLDRVALDSGPALLDVVLSVVAQDRCWRFLTHKSRRLSAIVDELPAVAD